MKWRKLLSIPKKHRRTRSGATSEVGSLNAPSEADPIAPRPAESTPDLRIGTSTLPTPGPLARPDQESNGTQMVIYSESI